MGALQAANHLGCRVPEDLAVVGFDDIPEARYFTPSLTTLRQPLSEMGAQAVRQLHRILTLRERCGPARTNLAAAGAGGARQFAR